ncbi:hypothetical protein C2E23DRAFT_695077, partial [Lenzites betulinus]
VHSQAISKVHPENVSAVVSDNTGNMRKCRELISAKYAHILNLQDYCHEINLGLFQIMDLDEFKEVCLWPYSTYAMEHYNEVRQELKITTGLAHIGATRFWTYVSTVDLVYQGLPAFQSIVQNKKLKIDIADVLFEKHSVQANLFGIQMVKYLAVATLFARAIKCLKSTSATASNVYVFWLAIMAQLEHVM